MAGISIEHWNKVKLRETVLAVKSLYGNDKELLALVRRLWKNKVYPTPFWHIADHLRARGHHDIVAEAINIANDWKTRGTYGTYDEE